MSDALTASPEIAVQVSGLCKEYQLGELGNLRRTLNRVLGRYGPRESREFSALAGIEFTVFRGESIGLVGTNGSGKSTFLQLLTGTTVPTAGEISVRGRVLPLLAVGLAFHPELTGRENVTLFASSLGIPRRTIAERLDAVLEFAGIEKHGDTPVKRYSSGMLARLSVAIAVQFPADIYVFDEVLAVVDDEFQERCIDEIAKLRRIGRTVFFVSHNQEQVRAVCDRVVWLERGQIREIGPCGKVLDAYHAAHHSAAA